MSIGGAPCLVPCFKLRFPAAYPNEPELLVQENCGVLFKALYCVIEAIRCSEVGELPSGSQESRVLIKVPDNRQVKKVFSNAEIF